MRTAPFYKYTKPKRLTRVPSTIHVIATKLNKTQKQYEWPPTHSKLLAIKPERRLLWMMMTKKTKQNYSVELVDKFKIYCIHLLRDLTNNHRNQGSCMVNIKQH